MTDEANSHASRLKTDPNQHLEIPIGLRPPVFVEKGRSLRLDAAAKGVLERLNAGHRIVALRGLPGEGKTQVLRQVAAERHGYYIELGDRHTEPGDRPSTDLALREGLSVIVEAFGEPSCAHRSLRTVCALVRNTLYRHTDNPLIVIDALDAFCSRADLESLLDASRGGSVVVGGPGAQGVTEVKLESADEQAFKQAYAESLNASVPLASEEQALIERISPMLAHNPLRAQFVAELVHDQSDRAGALGEFLESILSEPAEIDQLTASSVSKVWRHLTPEDRTRVALVAILGDPGIPISWLPPEYQVTAHTRAPLLTVYERQSERYVEAHRITGSYARQTGTSTLVTTLVNLLETWVGNEQLLDELKTRGARARALVRGCLYLKSYAGIDLPHPSSRVVKAFVDTAQMSNPDALLKHLSYVVDGPDSLWQLSPDVIGEIFDHIPQRFTRDNKELKTLRIAAFDCLDRLARSEVKIAHDAPDVLASAMHHAAKALLRTNSPDAQKLAIARFRELDQRCETLLPRNSRYYTEIAQIRLQMARSELLPQDERIEQLRSVLQAGGQKLPIYLRLAILSAMLDIRPESPLSAAEKLSLIQEGLRLCSPHTVLETQANFLRTAVSVCDRVGAPASVWSAVSQMARSLVAPAVAEALGDRDAAALGHALVKGASQDYSRIGTELILRALELYSPLVESAGPIVLSRLAAALRELGFAEESRAIAAVLYWNASDREQRYYATFDFSKALRASGRHREAIHIVSKERQVRLDRPDEAAALGDEYAKCAIRDIALREEIRAILVENARFYREAKHLSYAQRCERWLNTLEQDPVNEGALAEDEWRAHRRFERLAEEERQWVLDLVRPVAARPELAELSNRPIFEQGLKADKTIVDSGLKAWFRKRWNRVAAFFVRLGSRRSTGTSPLDVSALERRLFRDYTGIFGAKVFWAGAFTLLPLLIGLKLDLYGLRISVATAVYAVYHFVGIWVWMRVYRLHRHGNTLFSEKEKSAEVLEIEPFRRFAAFAGFVTTALLILTFVAKLTIVFGDQDVSARSRFPKIVADILGVNLEPAAVTD
ncbi:hypothetical protein [Nannocystis punicea]|uniref:AAA+ ATPase domain-containing protein n=1 Tax=Nannocystis punicea TaxID=2995304 RepID=A0ABY7HB67_9BACT|nr:hypothetical protein [Nannocystis poenicansa]WAS96451.1 hypothetical protein O0S08_09855 [Nannocystis poenicansa]